MKRIYRTDSWKEGGALGQRPHLSEYLVARPLKIMPPRQLPGAGGDKDFFSVTPSQHSAF